MDRISKEEIKQKIINHYGPSGKGRELIETPVKNCYDKVGSVLYSLNGSPPKGYGLYIPSARLLSLYDLYGKRYRIIRETKVER